MNRRSKGLSTTLPRSELPDSELLCRFCKKNDRQEDMSISDTKRTTTGKMVRSASHKSCFAHYKNKLNKCQTEKDAAEVVLDFGAGEDDAAEVVLDFELPLALNDPTRKDDILQKLINSF